MLHYNKGFEPCSMKQFSFLKDFTFYLSILLWNNGKRRKIEGVENCMTI